MEAQGGERAGSAWGESERLVSRDEATFSIATTDSDQRLRSYVSRSEQEEQQAHRGQGDCCTSLSCFLKALYGKFSVFSICP